MKVIPKTVVDPFQKDIGDMARTGKVAEDLYMFVLGLRSKLACYTQDLEGFHFVLQVMAERGSSTRLPGFDHRMALNLAMAQG